MSDPTPHLPASPTVDPSNDPSPSLVSPTEREAFLRRQGWSPDLPHEQRLEIEKSWPDHAIAEALLIGF